MIPVSMVGSQGLFVAIVISLLSTEIYRLVASRNLVIRMPDGVPPAVAKSFLALIPASVFWRWCWRCAWRLRPRRSATSTA